MDKRDLDLIAQALGSDAGALLPISGDRVIVKQTAGRPEKINCDGEDYFSIPLLRRRAMVVCGLGFVGYYVCKIAEMLGFTVYALDDRSEFADEEMLEGCKVFCGDFIEMLEKVPCQNDTSFVIVTRGHKDDARCLEKILRSPFGYLGMIGSRAKVSATMEKMRALGFSDELLKKVHSPIGLKIGARTPAEIAVAILAEVISEMGSEGGIPAEVEKLIKKRDVSAFVTIIGARGSVPRGIGSIMALTSDGEPIGTIGGGAVEARAIRLAQAQEPGNALVQLELTDAGDIGMVCGGSVEILINKFDL